MGNASVSAMMFLMLTGSVAAAADVRALPPSELRSSGITGGAKPVSTISTGGGT